jgi:hypothetical protein
MAHFAQINEDNVVTQVIVVNNSELLEDGVEIEAKGIAFCKSLIDGDWVQTSYNGSMRKQFAGVGYKYDQQADVFVTPRPYPSWSLDANHDWQPPVAMPTDGGSYGWNEETQSWVSR